MAAHIPQESPKKISEFSHHPRAVAINLKFRPKIQRKLTILDPFFIFFVCFGHNFLTDAFFTNLFPQTIYIFPVLRIDCCSGHYGHFVKNGHYGLNQYGHTYGQYGYFCEESEKCRLPVETK